MTSYNNDFRESGGFTYGMKHDKAASPPHAAKHINAKKKMVFNRDRYECIADAMIYVVPKLFG